MKKARLKFFSASIVIAMLTTLFGPSLAMAQSADYLSDEVPEVKELAEALEFVFEEALTISEDGYILSADFSMIEERFGSSPEIDELREQLYGLNDAAVTDNTIYLESETEFGLNSTAGFQRCLMVQIKDFFKHFIPISFLTMIVSALMDKEYVSVAKMLIKHGVKSTVAGLVGTLAYYFFYCAANSKKF